jgi:hypothetical protein
MSQFEIIYMQSFILNPAAVVQRIREDSQRTSRLALHFFSLLCAFSSLRLCVKPNLKSKIIYAHRN